MKTLLAAVAATLASACHAPIAPKTADLAAPEAIPLVVQGSDYVGVSSQVIRSSQQFEQFIASIVPNPPAETVESILRPPQTAHYERSAAALRVQLEGKVDFRDHVLVVVPHIEGDTPNHFAVRQEWDHARNEVIVYADREQPEHIHPALGHYVFAYSVPRSVAALSFRTEDSAVYIPL